MNKKKLILSLGAISSLVAPIAAVVACNNGSSSDSENDGSVEWAADGSKLVKNTDYSINDTNRTFFKIAETDFSDGNTNKLYGIAKQIAEHYKNISTNKIDVRILIKDGSKYHNVLLPSIILKNTTASSEYTNGRLVGTILLKMIERSVTKSKLESQMGVVKKADYEKIDTSKYFEAYDNVYKQIYNMTPIKFDETVKPISSYEWSDLFTKAATATVAVKPGEQVPGDTQVSNIEGTKVTLDGSKLPDDVTVNVYRYMQYEPDWNNPTPVATMNKTNLEYAFRLDATQKTDGTQEIYQNIWLQLQSTDSRKFVPAKYHQRFEMIKEGKGVGPSAESRRTNYEA